MCRRNLAALAAAITAGLVSGDGPPSWAEGADRPVPQLLHYEYQPDYGLLATGAVIFGASYFVTVIATITLTDDSCNTRIGIATSSLGCRDAYWPIYIPVAGPFIQMGHLNGPGAVGGMAMLAVDGVVQAGGFLMLLGGAAIRKKVPVLNERVQLSTYALPAGGGLLAQGRF